MEPVSFAVGIIGLAGLFSTCLEAVARFDSWKEYDFEFGSLVAQFKAQKLRLIRWGLAVGLEDDEISYEHNPLLDDPKIESTIKDLLSAINAVCRDEDKAFLTPMLGKDENPTKDQLTPRHAPRESKRQRLGWVLRTKAKRVAQVDHFSKLVETLHDLIPIEDPKGHKGRKPTGDKVSEADAWQTELKNILKSIETQIEDEYKRDLHAWLLGSASTNDLYEIFSERKIVGTCEWVLDQPWFLNWTSPDFPTGRAKVLWINGPAGFGKSVICARVIDYLSSNSKDPIAHFFFSADFESRRDPFVAIRSWLSQMIRHPVFFSLARDRLTTQQGHKATRGDTLRLLRDLVMGIPRCTFVLDGLDECRWAGQDQTPNDGASIVDFLEALRQSVAGTSTRILIVSRDEPEIRACLFNEASINDASVIQHSISPEDVRPDLEIFSRRIVNKKLPTKTEAIKGDITQKLAERCNGQFLWVQMQESQLRDGKSQKQLEKTINSTPPGLEKSYDREWMGISHLPEYERERAISLLRWAAFALRPLSVCELTGALLVSADCDEVRFDGVPDSINEGYIKTEIMELCGSLIDIRSPQAECDLGSRTVHLAHFSVKEYLLCNLPTQGRLLQLNSSLKSPSEGIENTLAAKMCLCYVDCQEVWQETPEEGRNQILGSFRDYAASSWYQHASFGDVRDSELVKFVSRLFDIENPNWASWKKWFDFNDESRGIQCTNFTEDSDSSVSEEGRIIQTTSMSPLYYATWLGLTDTMDLLLRSKECPIDEQGNLGQTPLIAACERGDLEATKKLLDNHANVEIASDNKHTPLHTAACNGHDEVVKLLLEKDAKLRNVFDGSTMPLFCACMNGHYQVAQVLLQWEPDMIVGRGDIPLVAASYGGFLDIVQLLIQKGAHVGASNTSGRTALYTACDRGHVDVVRLLIDNGAELNIQGPFGWTQVNIAADRGFLDIVLLLIEKGADIHIPNENGDTPLYSACNGGFIEVVRLLLDKGADIHQQNQFGWTPVNGAADEGFFDVVQLLIERGADIHIVNKGGEGPLYNACYGGHIEVVRLLLDEGADIHHQNRFGWTPVQVASDKGFSDIVLLLIERGAEADINLPDQDGETTLYNACYSGRVEVVKELVANGADLEFANESGVTPLNIASLHGFLDVIAVLLEKGAAIKTTDIVGRTPIYMASLKGYVEVINLLLEKGANISTIVDGGLTPLYAASSNGHTEVVILLLEKGACISTIADGGFTPLYAASSNGHTEVVNLLLEKGASISTIADGGFTPLYAASSNGHTEVVNLLLERGANTASMTNGGHTPLHAASSSGYLEVVNILLEKGANIASITYDGSTPLHNASLNGYIEVINLLLEKGANIASVAEGGVTPLHDASLDGCIEVVNLLLEKGAIIESVTKGGATPLHFASLDDSLDVVNLLLDKGAAIESLDVRLGTPLHIASASGHTEIVNLLLKRGAAVESGNFDDRTLLHYISPRGQLEVINNFLHSENLRIDIRVGSCTPLFYVVARGRSKVVKLLLLPPLSENARDWYSVMRLLAAARNGYEEVIDQLVRLAGLKSSLDRFGRDLMWWAIGIGRGRIFSLIRQWYYTENLGARIPRASDDKLWSLVNLNLGRICDVCTRPILVNTPYRRCEGCNNFSICLHCSGFKVICLDTAHEWSSCGPDGSGDSETDKKDERGDSN